MNCSGTHRPDRNAMGRKIRFTMAGDAAPETSAPTNMPMAQNGSAPSTSIDEQAQALRERQRHVADEHRHQREHQRDDRDEQHGHGGTCQ